MVNYECTLSDKDTIKMIQLSQWQWKWRNLPSLFSTTARARESNQLETIYLRF